MDLPGGMQYRIVRRIAHGGMGSVYEAFADGREGFSRRVAIKRMRPDQVMTDERRAMFLDEARLASHLHHGNIVQVLDYGIADRDGFLVMEFVEGVDAARAAREGRKAGQPLPEGIALHVIAEVAHALTYAHGCTDTQGAPLEVVHRDVSPQNVLLSWQGDVKLADFGIALSRSRLAVTAAGIVKGKERFMPPEQALGERVSPAADVYALGATLHALLAGDPPQPGAIERLRSEEPLPARIDPSLSPDVADLVRQSMSLDPRERPTADAMAHRAGRLSMVRLPRDGRGALREWLAEVRLHVAPPSTRSLDDLMGMCLVPTAEAGRVFAVTSTTVESPAPAGTAETRREGPAQTGTGETPFGVVSELTARRTRGRWPWIAASALGAALVLGAAMLALVPGGDSPPVAPPPPPAPPFVPPLLATGPVPPAPIPATLPAVDAGSADASPSAVASPVVPPRRLPPERPIPASRDAGAETPAVSTPTPRAVGYLRVGGASVLNGVVRIDGRAQPRRAPGVYEVTQGPHRVEVLDATSSNSLLTRSVEVGPSHGRTSPLPVLSR